MNTERNTESEIGLCGIELPDVIGVVGTYVTRHCADGRHLFCTDPEHCKCTSCHLGPCKRCGAGNLLKMFDVGDDKLCVDCYRTHLQAQPAPVTMCETCGLHPGFRNPGTRRNEFLCASCHGAAGEPLPLTSAVQGLVAACHGADVSDPRHEWAHVKGNTFGCVRCKVKHYDPDLRKAMRRGELNG